MNLVGVIVILHALRCYWLLWPSSCFQLQEGVLMLDSGFMPPFIPGLEMTETTKGEDVLLLLGITRWCSVQLGVVLLSTLHTLLNSIVCCLQFNTHGLFGLISP